MYRGGDLTGAWLPKALAAWGVLVAPIAIASAVGWAAIGVALGVMNRRRREAPVPTDPKCPGLRVATCVGSPVRSALSAVRPSSWLAGGDDGKQPKPPRRLFPYGRPSSSGCLYNPNSEMTGEAIALEMIKRTLSVVTLGVRMIRRGPMVVAFTRVFHSVPSW